MSDTLASILKQAEAHGILQRKVVKGGETEYLPTHPGEASTANKALFSADELAKAGNAEMEKQVADAWLKALEEQSYTDDPLTEYRHTVHAIADDGKTYLFRVDDGWGEWYIVWKSGKANWIAQKMPDVSAYQVSKELAHTLTKPKVHDLGWGDKAWDKFLAEYFGLKIQDVKQAAVTPPKPVQQAAALGLELRRQFGRGGTEVGVARARDLSNGRAVSEDTLTRMRSYFARHAVDAQADGWKDETNPSAGWIAWLLWGGDEGRDWAEGMLSDAEKQLTFFQAEKQHTGAMLALYPDTPPQFTLADADLTPTEPDELHVTMAYLGDAADLDEEDRAFLRRVCEQIASEFSPIQAKLGGIGRFLNLEDDDTQAYYASVDSPDIEALRARLVEVLGALGLLPDSDHGFTPHMTLAYVPVGKPAAGAGLQEEPVEFGGLSLSLAGERERFPFSQVGEKYSPGQTRNASGQWSSGGGGGG